MPDQVNQLNVHISFDNIDDRDIYIKLDLVLQFLIQNKLNGTVVVNRKDYQFDDVSGDDD